jgi:CRISPR-associated endonuclease/helicase Cas3
MQTQQTCAKEGDVERATGKAERLLQIEALLLAHAEGLTRAEIARRIGVHRSTITHSLPDLGRFCVYETNDGRLAIDRDHYLMNVRLTLHESMALHLAARLMATRTDKRNPHAATLFRKAEPFADRRQPLSPICGIMRAESR